MGGDTLAGLRILIVEDEAIIAMMLEDMIEDFGCRVVGPVARAAHALAKLDAETIDCAVLDINLNGETSYPIADALAARNLPFLFVSGYGRAGLKPEYRDRMVVDKPVIGALLEKRLLSLLGSAST